MKKKNFLLFCIIIFSSCASNNSKIEANSTFSIVTTSIYSDYEESEGNTIKTINSTSITSDTKISKVDTKYEDSSLKVESIIPRDAILAYCLDGGINFRSNSSFDSDIIRIVNSDEKIYILDNFEIYNNFYHITDGENVGYMFSDYVFPKEKIFYNKENGNKLICYTNYNGIVIDSVNLMSADLTNYLTKNDYYWYITTNNSLINISCYEVDLLKYELSEEQMRLFSNFSHIFFNSTFILHKDSFNLSVAYEEYSNNSLYDPLSEEDEILFFYIISDSLFSIVNDINKRKFLYSGDFLLYHENIIENFSKYDFVIKSEIDSNNIFKIIFSYIKN